MRLSATELPALNQDVHQDRYFGATRCLKVWQMAAEGVLVIDRAGTIRFANSVAGCLLGYAPSRVVGQNIAGLLAAPGDSGPLAAGRHEELQLRRSDGKLLRAEILVQEVELDEGKLRIAVLRDLADPGTAGTVLLEREERLRSILDTGPDAIIVIDERGLVESLSRAAERLFGYAAAEVVGRNVSMLMPSPYREEHDNYIERYRRTGERRIIGIGRVVVGQRADGSVFPMELMSGKCIPPVGASSPDSSGI
jgi:two-component system sensor kinase FixL